ncbi:hypothetical protein ACQEVG_17500 [Streptomyces sp. CA-135486]|uniref:WD40 repeat domain-containing protein n=1 Tax=Streptomyces sp. CA-135486 TaxID=3240049 RepID=UPI003D89FBD4
MAEEEPHQAEGSASSDPSVSITNAGAVAIGGSVTVTGGLAGAGRDAYLRIERIDQLTVIAAEQQSTTDPSGTARCPYPGFRAFSEGQGEHFHGRAADTAAVLDLVAGAQICAVVGASGSGKSSLVNAGVWAGLREGALPGSGRWTIGRAQPLPQPLAQLAALTAGRLGEPDIPGTVKALRRDPALFGRLSARIAEHTGAPVLWIIDQFEEALDPELPSEDRERFVQALLSVAEHSPETVRVLLALRSDFYHLLQIDDRLARVVAEFQYWLSPLGTAGLREAVERPAKQVGLHVEPELIDRIIDDAASGAGSLPLVAYSLERTWNARTGNRLTLAAYESAGGMAAAVDAAAQDVWERLVGHHRDTARRVLTRLAHLGPGERPTRRRMLAHDLVTEADGETAVVRVVQAFAEARFLTVDFDEATRTPTVEIGHEALLHAWTRLRRWLEADVEAKRLQDALHGQTTEWLAHTRDPEYLLPAGRLATVDASLSRTGWALTERERAYVDASRRGADQQRRRARLLMTLPWALVLTIVVAGALVLQQMSTQHAKTGADALQLAAQARATAGDRRDTAALLALAAVRTRDNQTTRSALVDVLSGTVGPYAVSIPPGAHLNVLAAALTQQGRAVVGSADGTVRMIDPASGGDTGPRLSAHRDAVAAVAVTGSGDIISGDATGTVLVQHPGRSYPLAELGVSQASEVRAVGMDPETGIVVAATVDGALERWALRPQLVRLPTLRVKDSFISLAVDHKRHLAFASTANGRLLMLSTAKRDAGPPKATELSGPGPIGGRVAVSGDGTLAAADGSRLTVWQEGKRSLPPMSAQVPDSGAVVIDPRSAAVYVGGNDGRVTTWSVRAGISPQGTPRSGLGTAVVGLATDGRSLVGLDRDGRLAAWDLAGRRSPASSPVVEMKSAVTAVAHGPHGELAVADGAGTVRLVRPGRPVAVVARLGTAIDGLAWTGPDALVIAGRDGVVRGLIPSKRRSAMVVTGRGPLVGVAAADGAVAAAWSAGKIVMRSPDGRVLDFSAAGVPVTSIALGPRGLLAVGTGQGRAAAVELWRPGRSTTGPQQVLRGHALQVNSLAFAPDGRTLASGSDDSDIRLWEVPSGISIATFSGHSDMVQALVWADQGRLLASSGQDGTVRLWSVRDRAQIGRPLRFADAFVPALSAAPDGLELMAANGPVVVRWPLAPRAWEQRACAFASRRLTSAEWQHYAPGVELPSLC